MVVQVLVWLIVLGLGASLVPGIVGDVGRTVEVAAVLALYVGALRPVGDVLLRPLERRYPPIDFESLVRSSGAGGLPEFVVVLGAGRRHYRPEQPATAALQPAGLTRLVEGIRIVRRLPGARLAACEFPSSAAPPRSALAHAAHELGIDEVTVVNSFERASTLLELRALAPVVTSRPFVLVTSAAHMARAVEVCRSLGMRALPAPTDFMARRRPALSLRALMPGIQALTQSDRALNEYAAWIRWKWTSR